MLGKFKSQEDLIKSYQELERKQSETPKEETKLKQINLLILIFFYEREFEENGS